jgi:hypothetical protein
MDMLLSAAQNEYLEIRPELRLASRTFARKFGSVLESGAFLKKMLENSGAFLKKCWTPDPE